ncbi:MAG: glycine cleavage system protein GcvH [Candidatus Krumholzibacteriia bacterium]
MDFERVRFTSEHEWVRYEDGSDTVTIGITDFASGELGDVVFVELPETGKEITAAEPIGTIEAVKTVADLFAPVSGVVAEINAELADNPGLVNQEPFADGWFIKVQLADRKELEGLMTHDEYQQMIGKE